MLYGLNMSNPTPNADDCRTGGEHKGAACLQRPCPGCAAAIRAEPGSDIGQLLLGYEEDERSAAAPLVHRQDVFAIELAPHLQLEGHQHPLRCEDDEKRRRHETKLPNHSHTMVCRLGRTHVHCIPVEAGSVSGDHTHGVGHLTRGAWCSSGTGLR